MGRAHLPRGVLGGNGSPRRCVDAGAPAVRESGVPHQEGVAAMMQGDRTIRDFGEQWTAFRDNEGYYASEALFRDIVEPLVAAEAFRGARVADIGSGTGRIVRMLAQAGAAHVLAVEPSDAVGPLRENVADLGDRVEVLHATGDALPAGLGLDFVVSFGVLHHIPEPGPVVAAALRALRPGGRLVAWLYGREGNETYLRLAEPLRRVTRRIPHRALHALSTALAPALSLYAAACAPLPALPMASYMRDHIARLSWSARVLTIYDQLNPAYARYYTRDEALALLRDAGFTDVRAHHRHGYSWTVVGQRAWPEGEGR